MDGVFPCPTRRIGVRRSCPRPGQDSLGPWRGAAETAGGDRERRWFSWKRPEFERNPCHNPEPSSLSGEKREAILAELAELARTGETDSRRQWRRGVHAASTWKKRAFPNFSRLVRNLTVKRHECRAPAIISKAVGIARLHRMCVWIFRLDQLCAVRAGGITWQGNERQRNGFRISFLCCSFHCRLLCLHSVVCVAI